jgi:hypothetical protein
MVISRRKFVRFLSLATAGIFFEIPLPVTPGLAVGRV